jgi:diguanylate cyclase (GGDEF)-like protein
VASEGQLSEVLSEFALTMVTDFAVQDILEHLVGRIVDMLPITAAGVTLISPTTEPRYIAASDASALCYEQLQTELGEGPCLAAYRTDTAIAVPDLKNDDRFKLFGPKAAEAGLGAVFTFPLRQGIRRLGALDLYRETPGGLDDDDMAAAQTLANVTAAYLVNAEARADLLDASARSHESAVHDPLTGLPNRILFMERLEHAVLRGRRSKKMVAVLFADLDAFKSVNDTFGHQLGDELLVVVAQRVTALLRPGDTLARLSGDEFVVLCEELDHEDQAALIAERIVDALNGTFELSGGDVDISVSVGIAFAGRGEDVPEQMLHDADVAMYQAKRKGGGHHQVIDLREQRAAEQHSSLERDLRHAAERGELRAEYQPIVCSEDGRIVGVEALLRWDHPARGPIPPLTLIPVAEQAGLITDIGRWVLERACVDRRRWAGYTGHDDFGMAVNVSAHQLMAPDFVATVADVLAATATPPDLITLELTESVFIQDSKRAVITLGALKDLGVLLALDDFGTGYSSLLYLYGFPIDVVKIDREFTAKLTHDRASQAIVGKVIELAHLLDMGVVTEGVETAEQLHQIARLGAESCQGYYFARPMPAQDLDLLIDQAEPGAPLHLPQPAIQTIHP